MTNDLKFASLLVQFVTSIIPFVVLIKLRVRFNLEFLLYLLFSTIATFGFIITNIFKVHNSWIFYSYQFLSIILLSLFYFRTLSLKLFKLLAILIGIISLSVFLYEMKTKGFTNWSDSVVCLSFTFCPLIYFFETLQSKETVDKTSLNIVNATNFIYFSTTIFLFYFIHFILKNNLWFIHNFIEASSKLIIAYAFWKLPKTSQF
jgi:hypothetical protein